MSADEAESWRPPEPMTASEWAERYLKIPARGNAEPGDYKLSRTPYLREPLDALGDDEHEEVILMKPPQFGGSQFGRAAIAFWAARWGDPILLVYPNEAAAGEEITERVAPMFEASPELKKLMTGRDYDVNQGELYLRESTVYVGWTGSAQAMASRAIACAVNEETDKAQRTTTEAGSDDLIRHRLKTFKRRKLLHLSTPTMRTGMIWRLYSETRHKREYHCACPSCGALECWTFEGVRWEGRDRADAREPDALLEAAEGLSAGTLTAWYECAHCHKPIHEAERLGAVLAGEWVSRGHPRGERPRSKRIAYHAEALISPWVTFADYVVAYLRGTLAGDLQDFFNGFRGLPAEEVAGKVPDTVFEERGREHRAWVVPAWATWLTAGADTQATGDRPYWVWLIRAWGPGLRSRLIGWGRSDTPDELLARTVGASFPMEGTGRQISPAILCVDSGGAMEVEQGTTTDIVYGLSKRDPARIVAVKGHAGPTRPDRLVRASNVDYQPPGMPPTTVLLHTLDTERLKDILARLIRSKGPVLWEESTAVDRTYVEQMTSEERIITRLGRKKRSTWANVTRRRNDLWDATVYCLAGAKILKVEERALAHEQAKELAATPEARPEPRGRSAPDPSMTRGDEQQQKQTRFGGRLARGGRSWISRRDR